MLNPNEQDFYPFCDQRETIFHSFMHCERLRPLFVLLEIVFANVNEMFTLVVFILVLNIAKDKRVKDGYYILFWVKTKWKCILVGNIKLLIVVVKILNCCLRDS